MRNSRTSVKVLDVKDTPSPPSPPSPLSENRPCATRLPLRRCVAGISMKVYPAGWGRGRGALICAGGCGINSGALLRQPD